MLGTHTVHPPLSPPPTASHGNSASSCTGVSKSTQPTPAALVGWFGLFLARWACDLQFTIYSFVTPQPCLAMLGLIRYVGRHTRPDQPSNRPTPTHWLTHAPLLSVVGPKRRLALGGRQEEVPALLCSENSTNKTNKQTKQWLKIAFFPLPVQHKQTNKQTNKQRLKQRLDRPSLFLSSAPAPLALVRSQVVVVAYLELRVRWAFPVHGQQLRGGLDELGAVHGHLVIPIIYWGKRWHTSDRTRSDEGRKAICRYTDSWSSFNQQQRPCNTWMFSLKENCCRMPPALSGVEAWVYEGSCSMTAMRVPYVFVWV